MMIRYVVSKHTHTHIYIYIIIFDFIHAVKPGYNDIGLYDNSSVV